jgi:hypothetical protein
MYATGCVASWKYVDAGGGQEVKAKADFCLDCRGELALAAISAALT